MSQDRTGPIIHVRENSDTELEALFNIAMNPSQATETGKYVPLRMRNLPASFFRPPEPPKQMGVSKDNVSDAPAFHGAGNPSVNVAHLRAHSSPASLQQSLRAAPPPPSSHVRQHSYDALDEQPLPAGWDMAKTPQGQRYYLNHLQQITTWEDPRKTHGTANPAVVSTGSSTTNNNNNLNTANLNNSPQAGSPSISSQLTSTSPVNVEKIPLPLGWEKAYTADGEVYFINHRDRTTSWFHPSVATHLQRPGMKFQHLQQQQQQQISSGSMSPEQEQLKHLKLQQLQMEQERLKKRQDEIARQEMALRAQVSEAGLGTPGDIMAVSQASEMTTVTDPFFGQTGTSDHHSRQESGDSGLGGMGTSYSLPRTPDFLGNMEDMDTQDGGKLQGQSDFGSMDVVGVNDMGDHLTMDSEDLVPSLQEEINSELLLKDVETVLGNKDNPLTWL